MAKLIERKRKAKERLRKGLPPRYLWVDQGRDGKGGHAACTEGEVGVDQGSHLRVPLCSGSRVEAWPEDPEERGSHLGMVVLITTTTITMAKITMEKRSLVLVAQALVLFEAFLLYSTWPRVVVKTKVLIFLSCFFVNNQLVDL